MNHGPWCSEINLGNILKEIFPNEEIIHDKFIKIGDRRIRPDYRIDNKKLLIEFQGKHHYTNLKTVLDDITKGNVIQKNGWTRIEIPYFVQLTYEVIKYLFGEFTELSNIKDYSNNFPHGFIHPEALTIGHFCIPGIKRCNCILENFPKEVKIDCFKSLKKRAMIDGVDEEMYNPLIKTKNYLKDKI